jgi:hypothetical protein
MTALLAVLMAVVAVSSGSRVVVPSLRDADHRGDVDAWHGVMAASMAAMLVVSLPDGLSRAGLAVFTVGAAWCAVQVARGAGRGSYLRLGLCCAAMLVMLAPRASGTPGHSTHETRAMPGMHEPVVLVAGLVVALVVVAALGASRLVVPGGRVGHRLGAACEILTAGAMVYMLAVMV